MAYLSCSVWRIEASAGALKLRVDLVVIVPGLLALDQNLEDDGLPDVP